MSWVLILSKITSKAIELFAALFPFMANRCNFEGVTKDLDRIIKSNFAEGKEVYNNQQKSNQKSF